MTLASGREPRSPGCTALMISAQRGSCHNRSRNVSRTLNTMGSRGGRWTVGLVMAVSVLTRNCVGEFADYYDLMDYTGYDYSYDSDYGFVTSASDCEVDAKTGKSTLNGTACDLNVSGDDLTVALKGGITGIYRYQACQNGRPYYKRDDIQGQVRVGVTPGGIPPPRHPAAVLSKAPDSRAARGRGLWCGDASSE
jgi:hypothetical protein